MMKSAYHSEWIYNLHVIKLAKNWLKHRLIESTQYQLIEESYKTPLIHPNFAIRILLFMATVIAVSGASGLVFLIFSGGGETTISIISILLGLGAFVILERIFIHKNHYKSGVTEGIAYMACGFVIFGFAMLFDFDSIFVIQFVSLLVFAYAAYRYLDLLLTLAFVFMLSWTLFYYCYEADGIFRSIIPFVFMITFSAFYFLISRISTQSKYKLWNNNLLVMEVTSLILVYAGGNYLVVRELSLSLMNLELSPGEDIPFAFLFYFFTVVIPMAFLFMGIRRKDKVLLRTGLITLAFTVFTFKYYFSFGHPEIAMIVAGIISIILAVVLMRQLKAARNGFTSENILSPAWASINAEAFLISQTMGGNQLGNVDVKETGGGGNSGGGGASSSF
jgi:hypothetical protein